MNQERQVLCQTCGMITHFLGGREDEVLYVWS